VGQIYPSRHVVLQAILEDPSKPGIPPGTIKTYPLYPGAAPEKTESHTESHRAQLLDKIKNAYIPALESMPEIVPSNCTPANYSANNAYQYLPKTQTPVQDYFARGRPENCKKQDSAIRYTTDNEVSASYPVIALPDSKKLSISYKNAGKLRPLSAAEKQQVAQYTSTYKDEFKQIYTTEYNEKTNGAEFTTLANARILLEAQYGQSAYTLRISSWEHITVAHRIYLIIEMSILKGNELINTVDISRYRGKKL